MAGSGAGNEGDVDGDAVPRQLASCVHGDVVDAADVAQRIERRNVDADAHEFINIIVGSQCTQAQVFLGVAVGHDFLDRYQGHVPLGVEGQDLAFIAVEAAQDLHEDQAAPPVDVAMTAAPCQGHGLRALAGTGKEAGQDALMAAAQPAAGRFVPEAVQIGFGRRDDSRRRKAPFPVAAVL